LARKCAELNSVTHLDGLKFDFEEAYSGSADDQIISLLDGDFKLSSDAAAVSPDLRLVQFVLYNQEHVSQMQMYELQKKQQEQEEIERKLAEEEAARPWYGRTRYAVVDHVLEQIDRKERKFKMSAVQEASLKSQKDYLQPSMADLGDDFTGPKKYLKQRSAPLEIPFEVVRNLFGAMDENMDDRIGIDEIQKYAKVNNLPFDDDLIVDMFYEATRGRGVVHERQKHEPLTIEEIMAAVRGRYAFDRAA
jgi:hypothetical protein